MSIASELSALNGYILGAYDEVSGKGGTMPANKNMANLATAIGSIESVGIPREVSSGGIYQMPRDNFTFSLPANATDIGSSALAYAFRNCTGLSSVDLSSLTKITGSGAFYYAFYYCNNLSSVDLSSLTKITDSDALYYAFYHCISLRSIDLSSLTTVTGSRALAYAFSNCQGLSSVDLSSLTTVTGSRALYFAFQGCNNLTSLSFPALTTSSFGTATDQFDSMLSRVRGCTVHFPASIQSTIGNWTSVQNGFNGTNTTVLFDL